MTTSYQTIEVRKLTPVIGAEVFGVDLSKDLGNQQAERGASGRCSTTW